MYITCLGKIVIFVASSLSLSVFLSLCERVLINVGASDRPIVRRSWLEMRGKEGNIKRKEGKRSEEQSDVGGERRSNEEELLFLSLLTSFFATVFVF